MPLKSKNLVARYGMPILLFLFVGVMIRDTWGYKWDNDAFLAWAGYDLQWGVGNAYNNPYGTDYMPLYHYLLYGYAWLLGDMATLKEWFPFVHLITFLFDILGIWFIYRWTDKRYEFKTLLLALVLNIGYSYNTLMWGQVDGILATLLLASLYFAWKEHMVLGAVFFILAINMKLQAIVLLPVLGLLYIAYAGVRRTPGAVLLPLVAAVVTQTILLVPFMMVDGGPAQVWRVATESVGKFPYVSLNAYNFWYLVYHDPVIVSDSTLFVAGLSHKQFGLLLFTTASFLVMLPLMKVVWMKIRARKPVLTDRRQLWLVAAIVTLLFFYCNTQMHERYCHPALVFVAVYAFYTKDFFPFLLFSVTYFLSMERVLQWLQLNVDNTELLIFNTVMLSLLYLCLIGYLVFRLVQVSLQREEIKNEVVHKGISDKPIRGLSENTA